MHEVSKFHRERILKSMDLGPNPNPFLLTYSYKEIGFGSLKIQIHAIQTDHKSKMPITICNITSHHITSMSNARFVASKSPSTYRKSKMLHSFKKLPTPELYLVSSEFHTFHKEENYMEILLRLS